MKKKICIMAISDISTLSLKSVKPLCVFKCLSNHDMANGRFNMSIQVLCVNVYAKYAILKKCDFILLFLVLGLTITLSSSILWKANFHFLSMKSCTTWDNWLFLHIKVNRRDQICFVSKENESKVPHVSFEHSFSFYSTGLRKVVET